MNQYNTLLAAATTGLLATSAQAAVIYDESVDGDLAASSYPTLTSGAGTVLGSISLSSDGADSMRFTGLTPGSQISLSIDTTFSGYNGFYYINISGNDGVESGVYIDASSYNETGTDRSVNDTFEITVPVDGNLDLRFSSEAGPGSLANYNATVSPIPEPSTSALIGLSALALAARRKRQA